MLRYVVPIIFAAFLSGCGPQSSAPGAAERPSAAVEQPREAQPAGTAAPKVREVTVYFARLEGQEVEMVPVKRSVSAESPAKAAVEALLKGPTAREKERGLDTEIPEGTRLEGINLKDGTARAAFTPELDRNIGGSMRVTTIRRQIEETLRQFPTVKEVVIEVEGRTEDVLQP